MAVRALPRIQPEQRDCCEWDKLKDYISMGVSFTILPGIFNAAVTWLVSSSTAPLVAGVLGPVTVISGFATLLLFDVIGVEKEPGELLFYPSVFVINMGLSLLFTAIGFPVSIPLSLLLVVTTAAGFLGGFLVDEWLC